MFEKQVLPRLLALGLGGGVLVQRKINTFGAGESAVEEKLLDLTRRGHVPEVGITASDATISLRILARAADAAEAAGPDRPGRADHPRTARRPGLRRRGRGLAATPSLRLLAAKRQTLATAEGVTAGLVATRLASVPGASAWFRGGVVAYDNRLKVELLGVPQRADRRHRARSAPRSPRRWRSAAARACAPTWPSARSASPGRATGPGQAGRAGLRRPGLGGRRRRRPRFSWSGTRAEVQRRTAKLALNRGAAASAAGGTGPDVRRCLSPLGSPPREQGRSIPCLRGGLPTGGTGRSRQTGTGTSLALSEPVPAAIAKRSEPQYRLVGRIRDAPGAAAPGVPVPRSGGRSCRRWCRQRAPGARSCASPPNCSGRRSAASTAAWYCTPSNTTPPPPPRPPGAPPRPAADRRNPPRLALDADDAPAPRAAGQRRGTWVAPAVVLGLLSSPAPGSRGSSPAEEPAPPAAGEGEGPAPRSWPADRPGRSRGGRWSSASTTTCTPTRSASAPASGPADRDDNGRSAAVNGLKIPLTQMALLSDGAEEGGPAAAQGGHREDLADFLAGSRPQDRVLLLFAGHAVELGDEAYLVPFEGELDNAATLMPLKWLYGELAKCPACQKVLVLDVCRFSPTLGQERRGGGADGPQAGGRAEEAAQRRAGVGGVRPRPALLRDRGRGGRRLPGPALQGDPQGRCRPHPAARRPAAARPARRGGQRGGRQGVVPAQAGTEVLAGRRSARGAPPLRPRRAGPGRRRRRPPPNRPPAPTS